MPVYLILYVILLTQGYYTTIPEEEVKLNDLTDVVFKFYPWFFLCFKYDM